MATPATSVCFICNKSLSEGAVVTVKKRGIETLTKSSVLRMLPDHTDLLKDLNEIAVHRGCQKTYTNSGMIAASIKRLSVLEQEARPSTRSKRTVFNFKNHCFMCGERITAEFLAAQKKLPFSKRNNVITVEMPSLRETVWKTAENRGDEWAHNIINRLQITKDLFA
ncbi:hypothetical protein AVEN_21121-1 [Araneus ventricosus]|uniref:Uncharacterized protein n=1 Tax=Araneus ventricosus TaxID=182803 RepID=A0A4Y1ZM23_ARAVE|nr:hypothetical protein AVEN_21121-1 [Araneus ventricosus]